MRLSGEVREPFSFREFLTTGTLGNFSPERNLLEVAELLGPPQDWDRGYDDAPYPLYWGYEDKRREGVPRIEVSFRDEPPHAMNWFQFEHACLFSDDVHLFGDTLAVSMDGFTGKMRASELIVSGAWDPRETRVFYKADIDTLVLAAGQVCVHYLLERGDADQLGSAQKEAMRDAFGRTALFAAMDTKYRLDSIYSFPARTRNDPGSGLEMRVCSGDQYLRSLQT